MRRKKNKWEPTFVRLPLTRMSQQWPTSLDHVDRILLTVILVSPVKLCLVSWRNATKAILEALRRSQHIHKRVFGILPSKRA